jgi:hypothetical protein
MKTSKIINPISNVLKHLTLAGTVLLGVSSAWASTASVSGPWNDPNTWLELAVPTSTDPVIINTGITVSVPTGVAAQCTSITVGGAGTSIVLDGATSSLVASGNVLVDRPDVTGNINQIDVGAGTFSAGSLVLGSMSSTTGSSRKTDLLISTGTATITGDLTTYADAARILFSDAGKLNIGGLVTQNVGTMTFTPNAGTVDYNGAAQTVAVLGYYNLSLTGSGAKTMASGISVSGKLTIAPTGSAIASVANGANLGVGGLTLGAVNQVDGTWGSSGSTATHQDDTFFDATTSGILNVGSGGLIKPVAATAQSYYAPDDRAPVHAIDGSGMTPNSPVTASSTCGTGPGGNMWLSNGNQDTWITFDLGSVQTIAGFHLWNYNEESGNGEYQRGVKTAGIYKGTSLPADGTAYASAGAAWGTLVENMTFTMAPGTDTYTGEDYFFATPVITRYLQIHVTSNFGTFDDYTGISEIRFIAADVPAAILNFGTNVTGSSAVIGVPVAGAATITWTLSYDPYGKPGGAALIAALAPEFTLSSGTCTDQTSGAVPSPAFPGPVTYTVTDGGTTNVYTVTTTVTAASTACDITSFTANFPGSTATITTTGPATGTVVVHVPYATTEEEVNLLAPGYTLSAGATCDQTNSAVPTPALSLTTPVHYTATAEDGTTTKDYTVTVVVNPEPPAGVTGLALWLDAAKITGLVGGDTVNAWPDTSGQENHAVRNNGAPTYQTSVINGQPVVRFYSDAGVGDYFGFPRISTIRTVFWVLKEDVDHTTERNLFLLGDSDAYDFHRGGGDNLWADGAASGSITGGTTRLMGAVVDGATTPLPRGAFQLVSLVTTGNVQANQITQDRVYHGSWKGDIAEVLIYSRELSAEEESAVGKYLATKYGLATTSTAATITGFGTNVAGSSTVISPVVAGAATIAWTVPYGTDVAALAPTYTVSSGEGVPASGSTRDFSGSVDYTVTDTSTDPDTINTYTVTATAAPPSTSCDITAFNPNLAGSSAAISTTSPSSGTVVVYVPLGTTEAQVNLLAPNYTLSAGATCDQANSAIPSPTLSLSSPVTYTVTAQDGSTTKAYTVTVVVSPWTFHAWTGDADSGITSASTYTAAVNFSGSPGSAVTVNGVYFEDSVASGANFLVEGDIAGWGPDGAPNVTGDSLTLANSFIYGGNPRTVTLTNLTPGATYEASLFAFGFDAAPATRIQTFASGGDSRMLDQNFYGQNNGIRIAYTFVADSSGEKVLTITPVDGGYNFHLSALANRQATSPLAGYAAWVAVNAPGQTPDQDYDNDGVANGTEYVLGGTKDTNDLAKLPQVSTTPGGDMLFTFERDQASIDGSTTVFVEVSTDLATWATPPSPYAVPDGAVSANPGVSVVKGVPSGFDTVTLSLPQAPNANKFARLKVVVP